MKATNWVERDMTRGQVVNFHIGHTLESNGTVQLTLNRPDGRRLRISLSGDEARQWAAELNASAALAHLGKL